MTGLATAEGGGLAPLAYRPEAAAKVLGISRSALYMEIASGRLKSTKIGRSRIISRAALEAFLRELEEEGR